MSNRCWKALLLLLPLLIALSACSSTVKPPSANGGIFRQHNEGYSLLYKLMSDERDVGKIFILKDADPSVTQLVKEIGAFCQSAKTQMDEFPKSDNRIEYDVTDLPYMEQKSRDLQASVDTHALLFSSGKQFEVRLIFTQAQAMDYAVQLSKALEEVETDPARRSFLANMVHRCTDFHDRLMNLLTVNS